MADLIERANRWLNRRQQRAIAGCHDELAALREDRHELTMRLELLSKVSSLVGKLDLEELLPAVAQLSIPELADWSLVDVRGDDERAPHLRGAARSGQGRVAAELMRQRPWREASPGPSCARAARSSSRSSPTRSCAPTLDNDEHLALVAAIGVRSASSCRCACATPPSPS